MSSTNAVVCRQCGSLRTRNVSGNPLQRVVAVLRRQQVMTCHRCGWRGRQAALRDGYVARRSTQGPVRTEREVPDLGALDRSMADDPGTSVLRRGKA